MSCVRHCKCRVGSAPLLSMLPTPRFTRRIGLFWNCPPRVKKLLGAWADGLKLGYYSSVIRLPAAALFSSNLLISCQFKGGFEPFQCPRTFYSSFKHWLLCLILWSHVPRHRLGRGFGRGRSAALCRWVSTLSYKQ